MMRLSSYAEKGRMAKNAHFRTDPCLSRGGGDFDVAATRRADSRATSLVGIVQNPTFKKKDGRSCVYACILGFEVIQ